MYSLLYKFAAKVLLFFDICKKKCNKITKNAPKDVLSDYIFSDSLRYEAHKLIYTYSDTEDPIVIGGFLGAALLCVRLINSEEGDRREIPLNIEQQQESLFIRYDQEVLENDWGYLDAEIEQLNDAYIQIAVSEETLDNLCPNVRQQYIVLQLVDVYMQRLVKEDLGEHIWIAEPWKKPFAQWLLDARYTETRRQQLLHINWTDPTAVNALVDLPEQDEEPTFRFAGEEADDIIRRYWEWLWRLSQRLHEDYSSKTTLYQFRRAWNELSRYKPPSKTKSTTSRNQA